MVKNPRTPGPGGSVAKGFRKHGRNARTGRFLEIAAGRGHGDATVPEARGVDRVGGPVLREDRVATVGRMVEAVMRGAADGGLTLAKDGRIAGRVSRELIALAKARTGLQSDTELVEFALANVALDDDFAAAFREVGGTVDPELDLGF